MATNTASVSLQSPAVSPARSDCTRLNLHPPTSGYNSDYSGDDSDSDIGFHQKRAATGANECPLIKTATSSFFSPIASCRPTAAAAGGYSESESHNNMNSSRAGGGAGQITPSSMPQRNLPVKSGAPNPAVEVPPTTRELRQRDRDIYTQAGQLNRFPRNVVQQRDYGKAAFPPAADVQPGPLSTGDHMNQYNFQYPPPVAPGVMQHKHKQPRHEVLQKHPPPYAPPRYQCPQLEHPAIELQSPNNTTAQEDQLPKLDLNPTPSHQQSRSVFMPKLHPDGMSAVNLEDHQLLSTEDLTKQQTNNSRSPTATTNTAATRDFNSAFPPYPHHYNTSSQKTPRKRRPRPFQTSAKTPDQEVGHHHHHHNKLEDASYDAISVHSNGNFRFRHTASTTRRPERSSRAAILAFGRTNHRESTDDSDDSDDQYFKSCGGGKTDTCQSAAINTTCNRRDSQGQGEGEGEGHEEGQGEGQEEEVAFTATPETKKDLLRNAIVAYLLILLLYWFCEATTNVLSKMIKRKHVDDPIETNTFWF